MSTASSKAKKQGTLGRIFKSVFLTKDVQAANQQRLAKLTYGPVMALFVAVAAYIAANVLSVYIMSIYPLTKGWTQTQTNEWFLHSAPAQSLLLVLASCLLIAGVWWFVRRRKQTLEPMGIVRPRPRDSLYAVISFVLYFIALAILVSFVASAIPAVDVDQKQEIFTAPVSGLMLILAFVPLVIIAPLTEELLFRGFLYSGLRKKLSFWTTAVIVSAIFGSLHLSGGSSGPLWIAALDTMLLSLFLCYLRERTGSVWSGVFLHALKNLVAFIGVFVITQ